MSHDGVYAVGIYEHPTRNAIDKSVAQLHAEVAEGALKDAGLSKKDIDGYFCAGDAPGLGPLNICEYLGLNPKYVESTDVGGSSYILGIGHALRAIESGECSVVLITLAGRPKAERMPPDLQMQKMRDYVVPDTFYEFPYGFSLANMYGMCAQRHMHEFGTTSEQLAWIKVAASHHAQHNPNAVLPKVVTVEDVLNSPMISTPLHRLDCCVISDGGGAVILANKEVARSLNRPLVRVRGAGEAVGHTNGGQVGLTSSAGVHSGARAFAKANVTPKDIKYASLYDSFTITVLIQLEDLGFCEKGQGGRFVADGGLISGVGPLAVNTDGGGLCNNHPANRGGMTKILEAVRQLRGEAHPAVQVANCDLALAHGTGGSLANRHGAATVIMERL